MTPIDWLFILLFLPLALLAAPGLQRKWHNRSTLPDPRRDLVPVPVTVRRSRSRPR